MREEEKKTDLKGIITSRQCPECGHHEVGFITEDGVFHPLRPGTMIRTLGPWIPVISWIMGVIMLRSHKDLFPKAALMCPGFLIPFGDTETCA